MNELALFAGAGGGILGGHLLGWRTVCAVEWEPYAAAVLVQRQNDGILPPFPIWDDVQSFDGKRWRGLVDVVSAGFPCQPFSVAGKGKADADERNMWPATIRIIREVRPQFAFLENVPGLLTAAGDDGRRYFGRILGDLAEAGYDARWTVLGADDLGAPHRRKRLWMLAYPATKRLERGEPKREQVTVSQRTCNNGIAWWENDPADIPNTEHQGYAERMQAETISSCGGRIGKADISNPAQERSQRREDKDRIDHEEGCGWDSDFSRTHLIPPRRPSESHVGRVANGVAHRVDRLKAIGNGQVPAVAAAAWEILMGG